MIPLAMNGWAVTIWTVVIIALSAFFVAVEFALMAAKQHRLEERATTAAGRAALKNSHELSVLLAGSQLGITACTLALGAITKPAVHPRHHPWLTAVGLTSRSRVADVVSFVLALIIVTFLHLVIGEMAPKSWAIAHPEDSSVLLALPMRGFMFVARPILQAVDAAANWLVRRAGAEPVDGLSASQDPAGLSQLVEHSANVGALDVRYRASLTQVLTLRDQKVRDLLPEEQDLAAVGPDATLADVVPSRHREHDTSKVGARRGAHRRRRPRPRHPGRGGPGQTCDGAGPPGSAVGCRPRQRSARRIRQARTQIAVITDGGRELGVITLADVLPGLMPSAIVDSGVPATAGGAH